MSSLDARRDEAIAKWKELGMNTTEAALALKVPRTTLRDALKRWRDTQSETEPEKILPSLEDAPWSAHYDLDFGTKDELTFGIVSDTHLCSKEERLAELYETYQWFDDNGVDVVVHAGDITAGIDIYRTQHNDLKLLTLEEQIDYVEKYYPVLERGNTYFIAGNHDAGGLAGRAGIDVGKLIGTARKDLKYLGQDEGILNFSPSGFRVTLHHPGGGLGSPGLKGQKWVNSTPYSERPHLLIMGHLHVCQFYFHSGVAVFLPGCFEGRTNLMRRHAMVPEVVGTIATLTNNEGSVEYNMNYRRYPLIGN